MPDAGPPCERELFLGALERDRRERCSFLDQACGAVTPLRSRIDALLRAHERRRDVLGDCDRTDGSWPWSPASEGRNDQPDYRRCWSPRLAGQRLGRYEIGQVVGTGGQATVYEAVDLQLHRRVALKVFSPLVRIDQRLLERFKREARATARLDHPGIAAIHDVGIEDDMPFLAMRLVEGATLATHLERWRRHSGADGPRQRRRRVRWAIELIERTAEAVHSAHEVGVVHRDLKPGNIMVTQTGEPVVLDFGIALDERSSLALTQSNHAFGTPAYMAPEQIDPTFGQPDRRTDVYALGVCLYEALTGHRPFEQRTPERLYQEIVDRRAPDPHRLNRAVRRNLETVLMTTLEKTQDRRYQTAADLAEDLRRVRLSLPIRARHLGRWHRAAQWTRRRPALAATFVTTFAVAVAGTALSTQSLVATSRVNAAVGRLADANTLAELERRAAETLWPIDPGTVPSIDRWLDESIGLTNRRQLHEEFLRSLRRKATQQDGHWTFATASLQLQHDRGLAFLKGLDNLQSTIARVRARRRASLDVGRQTIAVHRDEWRRTTDAIADSPLYFGLRIEPQIGLIPIGQDPQSHLFEFALPLSGTIPQRDEAGVLQVTEDMAIVLVLVPPGTLAAGNHPWVPEYSRPHRIALDPFFISKFEMTQAQWQRATGVNPSRWSPGSDAHDDISMRHPVEMISWNMARSCLLRIGLEMPTMAQWEYSARAGTTTRWCFGDDPESMRGMMNIADRSQLEVMNESTWIRSSADFDDGYVEHAAVGSFPSNRFGLHDVHGNVWEYTRDEMGFGPVKQFARPGDGERLFDSSSTAAVMIGGGYYEGFTQSAFVNIMQSQRSSRTFSSGVRPARAIRGRAGSDWDPGDSLPLHDNDHFGLAIDVLGDLDDDGVADLVVGSHVPSWWCYNTGAIWVVFLRRDGTAKRIRTITTGLSGFAPELEHRSGFGRAVATLGDLDADGTVEVAVGAPGIGMDGSDHGAVWILSLDRVGRCVEATRIDGSSPGMPSELADDIWFGGLVDSPGDGDGDGVAIVATTQKSVWTIRLGADGSVIDARRLRAFGEQEVKSIDIGDIDGDDRPDQAVSPWRSGSLPNEVEIVFGGARPARHLGAGTDGVGGWLAEGDAFGFAVAGIGDIDRDGVPDLVVGSPGHDDGGPDRGAIWVLMLRPDGTVKRHQRISATEGWPDDSARGPARGRP